MDIHGHCGRKMYINVHSAGKWTLLFTGGGTGKVTFMDEKNEPYGSQVRDVGH